MESTIIDRDAPEFTLPSSSGESFRLSGFRGKSHVVLSFFCAAFTGI